MSSFEIWRSDRLVAIAKLNVSRETLQMQQPTGWVLRTFRRTKSTFHAQVAIGDTPILVSRGRAEGPNPHSGIPIRACFT